MKIQEWLSASNPPEPSEIRQTRRFLAATGEYDPLTRRLAECEQRLREEKPNPMEPLRSHVEENEYRDVPSEVSMFSREPFRGSRRRILEQSLERFGGRVLSEDDGSFTVMVGNPAGTPFLKSLYNWNWETTPQA